MSGNLELIKSLDGATVTLDAQEFGKGLITTTLEQTLEFTKGDTDLILTMPDFIQARTNISKIKKWHTKLWRTGYDAFSELDTGKTDMGTEVAVVSHGNIVLNSPERLEQAYRGNYMYLAELTDKEFTDLLKGKLPNGEETTIIHYDNLEREYKNLPKNYSVILDKDILDTDR